MNSYFVYIVRCDDDSYYTGITNDCVRRVYEHNHSRNKYSYTYKRRPVELVYSVEFEDVNQAISWEKILKRWNRKKKEAVINDEWEKLPGLARCKNITINFTPIPIRLLKYITRWNILKALNVMVSSVEP